jgi:hypothetical protein
MSHILRMPNGNSVDYNIRRGWLIEKPSDSTLFFQGLISVVLRGWFIRLEGGAHSKEIKEYLNNHVAPDYIEKGGIIFKTEWAYHIAATQDVLSKFADFSTRHAEPEICMHFHLYGISPLAYLVWYDAFFDPIILSEEISEEKVRSFSALMNVGFNKYHEDV